MRFKKFIEDQQTTQFVSRPNPTQPDTAKTPNVNTAGEKTINLLGPNSQGDHSSVIGAKFQMLRSAMYALDPFQKNRGVISGTLDFMSPEQGRGETEYDNITNLYFSLAKSNKYLADMLKPVVQTFRDFRNNYLKLNQIHENYTENKEVALKLDMRTFAGIKSGVIKTKKAIDDLRMDSQRTKTMGRGDLFNRLFHSFDVFYNVFEKISPKFEAGLQNSY